MYLLISVFFINCAAQDYNQLTQLHQKFTTIVEQSNERFFLPFVGGIQAYRRAHSLSKFEAIATYAVEDMKQWQEYLYQLDKNIETIQQSINWFGVSNLVW